MVLLLGSNLKKKKAIAKSVIYSKENQIITSNPRAYSIVVVIDNIPMWCEFVNDIVHNCHS